MSRPYAGAHAAGHVYAALDLGTNNCRLLVASVRADDGEIRVLDSFSRIVRLGEGVDATGSLSEDAMQRTRQALAACQKKLSRHTVTRARFVATEACRRAENGRAFLDSVELQIGLPIEIITSEEEARLAFLGCASLLTEESQRALVFDIGGGSTELMWVNVENIKGPTPPITDWLSISYGVMNLADKFGGTRFTDLAFHDMVRFIHEKVCAFDEANHISAAIHDGKVQLLSTSGTVTTLAAVHMGLPRYDRSRIDGVTLPIGDLRATVRRLHEMRPSERFYHPCIGPDRADFILSGCAIFEAISSLWPEGDITIADRGVREGIILSLMNSST